jgi:alkaline phosphatase D
MNLPVPPRSVSSRRELARTAFRIAAAAFTARALAACSHLNSSGDARSQTPRLQANPFTLGVASGCPGSGSVTLWTRLAPEPSEIDGGMPPVAVDLRWEVAEDEQFSSIVASGHTQALPQRAHAVHVRVSGLAPAHRYWYRFVLDASPGAASRISPVGRTMTAAGPGHPLQTLRIAIASCQHYERGYFSALSHLADENPDLILFLGDYIYESNLSRNPVRRHWSPEPTDLAGYRLRYAQYRTDPDLQRAHAVAPWLMTWDDHEVDNDYANDRSQDLESNFLIRRAAAYLAYFEHMPLDPDWLPKGPDMQLYRRFEFGDLVGIQMLDCRQYRSHQACPKPGRGGSNVVQNCAELFEPTRSLLGTKQERWLATGLRDSRVRWNLIAQSTLFAYFDLLPGPGERFWTDGWSGYPAAAQRLLNDLQASGARNPIILGGDVHCHYVADVKADYKRSDSRTIGTEFCVTSITSPGMAQGRVDSALLENPHVLLGDARRRGYLVLQIERGQARADLRVISSPRNAQATIETLASFVVDEGRPGARRVGPQRKV